MTRRKTDKFSDYDKPAREWKLPGDPARRAASLILVGFVWDTAQEGRSYWNKVYDRLNEIARAMDKSARDAGRKRKATRGAA
jgi:hypothetical protein